MKTHTERERTQRSIELGKRIREIRECREFSQRKLSELTGVSQSTIAQIESNKNDASVSTLLKIAQGLNVDVAILFSSTAYNVHVFDLDGMKRRFDDVDKLTPLVYTAIAKVLNFAREIRFPFPTR